MAETRPMVSTYSGAGAVTGSVPLPAVFSAPIRPDVVRAVHTGISKNARQALRGAGGSSSRGAHAGPRSSPPRRRRTRS